MQKIADFEIQSYRGLRSLKLEDLSQINILVGENNSGKTSVLEALLIFSNPLDWHSWFDTAYTRELLLGVGVNIVDMLTWLFPQSKGSGGNSLAGEGEISLSSSGKLLQKRVTAHYEKFIEIATGARRANAYGSFENKDIETEGSRIHLTTTFHDGQNSTANPLIIERSFTFAELHTLPETINEAIPAIPVQFINPSIAPFRGLPQYLWSEVIEAEMKPQTIRLLKYFDPDIQDIDIISRNPNLIDISVKHRRLGRAPLSTFGSGLRRVFTLATIIPRVKNGILLIDEIESAIHTRAFAKTFDWLVKSCMQNDIQLFATAHSLEAIDTILDASRKRSDFTVYRLQQDKEQTKSIRLGKDTLIQLREELGVEIR